MGHHKQIMKNESGEAVQHISLWEQLQAGKRTFGDNRFVYVCECVFLFSLCKQVSKVKTGINVTNKL